MMWWSRLAVASVVGWTGAVLEGPAAAQDFPAKPIKIVAGLAPGGITDVTTRLYADAVSRLEGWKFVIENRAGAGGGTAAIAVQAADPDGYSLLVFSGSQHATVAATSQAAYEPVKGWTPITLLFNSVVVHANLKRALATTRGCTGFLPVVAPASLVPELRNEFYASEEAFIHAIAEALRYEYKAITDAGLVVQIDDAWLPAMYERIVPPGTAQDYRRWAMMCIEALNHALRGLPRELTRYHICWGSWNGPHTADLPLRDLVDLLLRIDVGGYSVEGANPRHEHEWRVWESVKLPEGRKLIPGLITHATNIVEHPELVCERIVRLARLVGRENVIASTDCGFAQGALYQRVHPSIMWAKLEALVEGAALATKALWR